jgi:hypothetical protein
MGGGIHGSSTQWQKVCVYACRTRQLQTIVLGNMTQQVGIRLKQDYVRALIDLA